MNDLFLFKELSNIFENINYIYLAIFSAFFAAISNLLIKNIVSTIDSKDILGINFMIMAGTLFLISPLFFYLKVSLLVMVILIIIAIIDTFANYYYFKAFEKSEVSIVTPILALAPVFTFIFGWFFINDKVSFLEFFSAIIIMIFTILFSTDFSKLKFFTHNTLIPAILSSILFGLSAIPSKYLLSHGLINALTLYEIRAILIGLMAFYLFGTGIKVLKREHYKKLFFRSFFVMGKWFFLYYALKKGNAGVTMTLANITPIFVFILSLFFLQEKFTLKKVLAIISICILVYIIS